MRELTATITTLSFLVSTFTQWRAEPGDFEVLVGRIRTDRIEWQTHAGGGYSRDGQVSAIMKWNSLIGPQHDYVQPDA